MAATQLSTAPQRVREYETIFILRGDVDPDSAQRVSQRVAEVIEREKGTLVKVESWGRRRLAYEIAKQRRGVYTYIKYLGGGSVVNELERNLRMLDPVIRFQTVLLRSDLVPAEVAVDPEEIQFVAPEPLAEDEKEESRERLLGLVEAPEEKRSRREEPEAEEVAEFDEPNLNPDLVDLSEEEES